VLTDPIADMLTRIRNANKALHEHAAMPSSKMKVEIARLLKEEGYIRDYHVEKGEAFDTLVVDLKFGRNRERVISGLKRVSKPGMKEGRNSLASSSVETPARRNSFVSRSWSVRQSRSTLPLACGERAGMERMPRPASTASVTISLEPNQS